MRSIETLDQPARGALPAQPVAAAGRKIAQATFLAHQYAE
jgi:hypothetical protein